jgi:CMP-N-acetylneuraminic acid synthetase
MRILAIVPARGGSKRLPGKNIRMFCGKPLIQWSLDFAAAIEWLDAIEVSTDDEDIAACCAMAGHLPARLRPAHLATDEATSVDVVLDMLDWQADKGVHFDAVALFQPTTPIRKKEHWESARRLLIDEQCDAVVGFGPARSHPLLTYREGENGLMTSFLPSSKSLRAQDLEPAFAINGSLYLIRTDVLRKARTFFPPATRAVKMMEIVHNLDIDTEFDWQFSEWVTNNFCGEK